MEKGIVNFTGQNIIIGHVFDGFYEVLEQPVDPNLAAFWTSLGINPTGITGQPVFFQSGTQNIDLGYYETGYGLLANIISGATQNPTLQSGYIYYDIATPIYGLCHGVGQDQFTWFSGYNFYNAFHAGGFISPPWGEQISLYKSTQDGTQVLQENGSCANLLINEYNDLYGIVSTTDPGVQTATSSLEAGDNSYINSPAIECPVEVGLGTYWDESQYKIIAGTASAITANTFYNGNPIPTSLDSFDLRVSSRYAYSQSGTYPNITFTISGNNLGQHIPSYPTSGGGNLLDNNTCFALLAGTSVNAGVAVESLLLDVPDQSAAESSSASSIDGVLFDPFNWWNFEQFLFKENSDGFPFADGYTQLDNGQTVSAATDAVGTQLFSYVMADSDNYWENRQCPNVVDFLPYTFGASIYACPSYYFDAPYYAVIKKFGFYGTRFFNGCVDLNLGYVNTGNPNASGQNTIEIPNNFSFISDNEADGEPDSEGGVNWSFASYDNLLALAQAEELQSDFYALNTPLFLWLNYPLVTGSLSYQTLTGKYSGFAGLLSSAISDFMNAFPSGKGNLLSGNYLYENGSSYIMYDTGTIFPILATNDNFNYFISALNKMVTGSDTSYWQTISNTYGNVILTSSSGVDTGFYYSLQTGRNSRFLTRYLENYVRGNPIDLYPTNKIWFGTDQAKNFIESSEWGKSTIGFGNGTQFTDTGFNRRYFLGAYGNGDDISGYINYITNINNLQNDYFYPGYFNSQLGLQLPQPSYVQVITGNIFSGNNTVTDTTITNGTNPLPQGWLGIGYNGIGQLKNNFSCFTPIFVQQPLPTVFCKIGDSPTFRSYAVDYHTIPEDKINIRYPEIVYWTQKLKTIDQNYNNLYPLSYSWYRILTGNCQGNFQNFLLNPDFSLVEPANLTGTWACLEGNGPFCTLIHAQQCIPPYVTTGTWAYNEIGTGPYEQAKINNFYMTFKKGANYGVDDQYYYFCMVTGRFGIRISEPSELFIEDWLQFDIAIQNGANVSLNLPITFVNQDIPSNSVTITASPTQTYEGFERDNDAIPETLLQEQIPPPDAGAGDAYSYQFIGNWGYKGALQSYTPGTLFDTRGLIENWNHMVDYGSLSHYFTKLTQAQGDFLYGQNHLPVCTDTFHGTQIIGVMNSGQKGIQVNIPGIVHWANLQQATVSTDGNYGVMWNQLENAGELYSADVLEGYGESDDISPGLGQWQWGNKLGTIQSFGTNSTLSDITSIPGRLTPTNLQQLQSGLFANGVLGGSNCGWNECGLGRNMLYFIEGFDSFYIYCDNIKKKNVQNTAYMGPGLRFANSSIQYFWLGKPNNTYVQRYPMFGPYAYQWKVSRHNRDRNGNGMPASFYSYGWNTNYSLMYDMPAIYGLVRKNPNINNEIVNLVNEARNNALGGAQNTLGIQQTSFGFSYSAQESIMYGDIFIGNIDAEPPTAYSQWLITGSSLAESPPFQFYGCSDTDLNNGQCFDPCISLRYANGFIPGGKSQDLNTNFPNNSNGYNLVANNIFLSASTGFHNATITGNDGVYFRGPFGTPHFKYLSSQGYTLNGFSPCFDGGADHCNYITATLNLGTANFYQEELPSFISVTNSIIQSVNYSLPSLTN